MINYLKFENGSFISEPVSTDTTKWLYVEAPTDEEIQQITNNYHLPKDYVTGILDNEEDPRFEGERQEKLRKTELMILRYPHAKKSPSGYMQLKTYPFALIITADNKLINVINSSTDFFKQIWRQPILNTQLPLAEAILLEIAWRISLTYNSFLKEMIKQTDKLEGELKVTTENKQLYQIMDIQKSLVYFESALSANLHVINMLYGEQLFSNPENNSQQLHDILVEIKQGLTTTRIQLKLVDKISDTFSAIVSNNLNNVMKILTSLTIVLTIPTIIGGVFGMNAKLPFADRENTFWWIFLVTVVLCILTIRGLKKKHLL
ncbi:magnesium transporter CorA family protein [Melissococcus plutonius]|uniref:magnesium transporter CorA family protein n=1 Tax=Melissococcus plutonius TaxID=33970 RepID=UPI00242F3935|nr:magnesium transporter CorA family protein [Melissococcus plutonius]